MADISSSDIDLRSVPHSKNVEADEEAGAIVDLKNVKDIEQGIKSKGRNLKIKHSLGKKEQHHPPRRASDVIQQSPDGKFHSKGKSKNFFHHAFKFHHLIVLSIYRISSSPRNFKTYN